LYFWGEGEDATKPYWYGRNRCVQVKKDGIHLPNGLLIRYPNLRKSDEDDNKYVYESRKGDVSIWGGSVVENVVQALARIVVGQQMLKIKEKYKVVLTVHDAAVCVVPDDEVEEAEAYIVEVMSTPPEWATGLPVACEAHHAKSYGDCS
jgi:DNA polymerase